MRDWVTSRCAGCLHVNGKTCDAILEPWYVWRTGHKCWAYTDDPSVKLHLFLRGRSGDVDNYCKSILDGLNGVAYEDDDQVVELLVKKHKVKRKEEERVEIEIREFGEGM